MTAIWGSTFFLIKDIVTRIPVADLLAVRFALASLGLALLVGRRLTLNRALLVRGAGLGVLYGGAQVLQTLGSGFDLGQRVGLPHRALRRRHAAAGCGDPAAADPPGRPGPPLSWPPPGWPCSR